MEIETNPFQFNVPATTEPITSLAITSNVDWLTIPDPVLGPEAVLPLNAKTDVLALKVFATGAGAGAPSMRSLLAAHIPNIEISQVNGLQGAINSLVKTLDGSNELAIEVTNNGVGDYLVTPHFGTLANTLAQGNDTRFPANVTGLRKSSGAGSTDVAAVAKTDYWNTDVFVASGASHAKGLVPDPGASAGTTKFLREDATWVVPAGSGTVTSVALSLPTAVFDVAGSPITSSGTFTVTLDTQSANTLFAGPTSGGAATPAFRVLHFNDVSALTGTGASNIAVGNDTRFPASVTGLRKSAGAGSTDTAAVAKTDYWNADVFVGKGPSHAIGLVPDPGAGTAPYTRYLREDASWQTFVPDTATITNPMLATMASNTVKANATGGTASPTDVDAKTARSGSLLNLESITTHGNSDYAILATDRYVATSATLTAARTWTLPLANTFNAGQTITISDDFGGINGAFTIAVRRSGSDLIQGKSQDLVLNVKFAGAMLVSDGSSKWSVISMFPSIKKVFAIGNGTYTTPTGCKALFVEGIAGGGGGAGAIASASNAALGGGGGGGGYGYVLILAPVTSYTVTIGTGGNGGTAGNNGSAGGNTFFGSVLEVSGGSGGGTMSGGTTPAFSSGSAVGGYINIGDWGAEGSAGEKGIRLSGTAGRSGMGGGAAVYSGASQSVAAQSDGNLGAHYGGGGSGGASFNASGQIGGNGFQGIILITEYY